jgi:type IV secretory pathway component VirB8
MSLRTFQGNGPSMIVNSSTVYKFLTHDLRKFYHHRYRRRRRRRRHHIIIISSSIVVIVVAAIAAIIIIIIVIIGTAINKESWPV